MTIGLVNIILALSEQNKSKTAMSEKNLTFIEANGIIIDSFWIDTNCKPYIDHDIISDLTDDLLSVTSVDEVKTYSGLQFHTNCYLHELENIYNKVNHILEEYDLLEDTQKG